MDSKPWGRGQISSTGYHIVYSIISEYIVEIKPLSFKTLQQLNFDCQLSVQDYYQMWNYFFR